jgi:hypothetical protein
MQTIIDETWATAAPLSVAEIRDVKYRLTSVLESHPRLPDEVGALLNDLVDVIGTLEVERFHLAQGALRADILRREVEQGGASDDLLTLIDTLFMEWALYVRDRAAGQPNPVARLVSLVVQHEERSTKYKAQAEAQAAEIAKLQAQTAQLQEALERAAAPQRMYTYAKSSSTGGGLSAASPPGPAPGGGSLHRSVGESRNTRHAGPARGTDATSAGATSASQRKQPRGAGGVSGSGAAALLQWLTAPVTTPGQHPPRTGGRMGTVQ